MLAQPNLHSCSITRVASCGPDCRKWLFSEVRGGIWTPHSPVLIKISADKRPLNQLTVTVKNLFFFIIHQNILPLTPSHCSWKKQLIWVFEWRKSVHYWWSYILFSPECKELTSMLDPLLHRWGVPPVVIRCVHWTMQMWVLQTWIKAQGLAIVMVFANSTPEGRAVSVTRELDLSLLCRIWLFGRHLVSLAKIAEVWPPFFLATETPDIALEYTSREIWSE